MDLGAFGVFQVDVFDVRAQVFDRGLGCFAADAVGIMQVPQRGEVVSHEAREQVAELQRVGVIPDRLHEQDHAGLLGERKDAPDELTGGGIVAGRVSADFQADVGHVQTARGLQTAFELVERFFRLRGDIVHEVEAGDAQAVVAEFVLDAREAFRPEIVPELRRVDIVDFDPVELVFPGDPDKIVEAVGFPTIGRERQFHLTPASKQILFTASMYARMPAPTTSVETPLPP